MKKEKYVFLMGSSSGSKKGPKKKGKKSSAPMKKSSIIRSQGPQSLISHNMFVSTAISLDIGGTIARSIFLRNVLAMMITRSKRLKEGETFLRLGNRARVAAKAMGDITLILSNAFKLYLRDVLFIPDLVKNIISISILDRCGYSRRFAYL
ncbi:hypothetical protein ZIOFF_065533 [Zingiber officinale]|uniref:Retrovirus-related Pol polyprotein from transposon TNT 1-94-like beta-barrel domain-containing protein n=1 Tax=Zingiber officinale TaxID=94328 RepID=A0A8J5K752_ZINOF|nr:hypothetical protein ZIOFF_065533 [Zingiber officinale]